MNRSRVAARAKKSERFILREAGLCFPTFTPRERSRLLARLKGVSPERRIRSLRIWKTEFFRHPSQLNVFRKVLLPKLLGDRKSPTGLRILSVACSSGEEIYTLGMILRDAGVREFQLTGVDLDLENLRRAEAAIYPKTQVSKQIPARYRQIGLRALGGRGAKWFQVRSEIVDRTRWVQRNVFDLSPKGARFDVVFCRNLFYYFESEGVLKALRRLHRMLRPGGFLIVSPMDKVPPVDQWKVVSPCVYQRN